MVLGRETAMLQHRDSVNLHRCKTAELKAKKNTPFIAWLMLAATPSLPHSTAAARVSPS